LYLFHPIQAGRVSSIDEMLHQYFDKEKRQEVIDKAKKFLETTEDKFVIPTLQFRLWPLIVTISLF